MSDVKQLSDGRPSGVCLGQSSSDKLGFYGLATPIVQPSVTQQSTATTTALRADINRINAALLALGLIAVT